MGKILSKTNLSKFVLFVFMSWSVQTYAQVMAFNGAPKEDASLKQKGRSQSLKSVLLELETLHNISFFYQSEIIQDKYVNETDIKSKTLEQKLSLILDQNNLKYEKVKDKVYILLLKDVSNGKSFQKINTKPGSSLLEGFSTPATYSDRLLNLASFSNNAEDVVISGLVTGEDAAGIPGVNVILKSTTIGTVTDVNGRYSIKVPNLTGVLVFSYVGYTTQEVSIDNRSVINLQLALDVKSLQEVVVVGYGTVKKSDVTGSLSSVSSEKIQSVPVQNISQALQGRAAGVDVSMSSFRPGEAPQIRIRGNRSLKATNNPLVVLDGIPLSEGSSINDFNPNDIERMEVLKDASATAIYGSRGANGVILITSKKGKAGKASITYDGYVGFSKPLVEIDMFDGGEYAELKREAYRNSNSKDYIQPFADPNSDFALFGSDYYLWQSVASGYEWEDEAKRIPKYRDITEAEREVYRRYYEQDRLNYAGLAPKDRDLIYAKLVDPDKITQIPIYHPDRVKTTDWADLVLRTGSKQSHQVSLSGGSENLSAYFSGGYYSEKGIQTTQGFERYNVRLGLDYKVSNHLRVGSSTNASLAIQDYGAPMYFNAIGQLPMAVPYDTLGNLIFLPGKDALIINPLSNFNNNAIDERKTARIMGSYFAEIKILDGLKFRSNFGPDFRQYRRGQYYAKNSVSRQGGTSQAWLDNEMRFNYVLENLLFYDKEFNGLHTLGVTLLHSIQRDQFESSRLRVQDLPYNSQLFHNLSSTNSSSPESFGSDYNSKSLMSYMARINYGYKNKYLITLTGRYDGSSVLAPGNKWDFFPSVALAWKMHEESFLKNMGLFDELKLRVGYGKIGNSAVQPYSTQGSLDKTKYSFSASQTAFGFRPNQIPNSNLKWESTATINAGIDFGFLNNRITGTVDVYESNTTDLIMDRQIPTSGGFPAIQENVGATRNKGLEISLTTANINAPSGFKWTTDFIFAKNKEEIVELYGGKTDDTGNRWFIGEPIVTYYDYKPIGVWQSDEVDLAKSYKTLPGRPKFLDVDNNGVINILDRVKRGNNVPDWSGSIANTFSYKGVELSFFFYARIGQTIPNEFYRPTLTGRYNDRQINYWTPGNPSNDYPRPNRNQERPENPDSFLYVDGSFVKLRTLSLSYTLPKNLIAGLKMDNAKVYVTAFNPLLFTSFEGGDPEFSAPTTRYDINTGQTLPVRNVNDQLMSSNNLSDKSLVFGVKVGF